MCASVAYSCFRHEYACLKPLPSLNSNLECWLFVLCSTANISYVLTCIGVISLQYTYITSLRTFSGNYALSKTRNNHFNDCMPGDIGEKVSHITHLSRYAYLYKYHTSHTSKHYFSASSLGLKSKITYSADF